MRGLVKAKMGNGEGRESVGVVVGVGWWRNNTQISLPFTFFLSPAAVSNDRLADREKRQKQNFLHVRWIFSSMETLPRGQFKKTKGVYKGTNDQELAKLNIFFLQNN